MIAATTKKAPHPRDKIIGANIRRLRNIRGMSQAKLGKALDLTFQQVQKYEKGMNRVGGARLTHICEILQCAVPELFTGIALDGLKPAGQPDPCMVLGETKTGIRMAVAFNRLPSDLQHQFVDLAESMANHLEPATA